MCELGEGTDEGAGLGEASGRKVSSRVIKTHRLLDLGQMKLDPLTLSLLI